MTQTIGDSLTQFDAALTSFHTALESDAAFRAALFVGTEEWRNLLRLKLLPHLAGEGCLIAAIAGGTNSGKSTIFNRLMGRGVSPVVPMAAATCRTLLAGSSLRARQSLDGKLLPEFTPRALRNGEEVLSAVTPVDTLFVSQSPVLPDRLVLLDTPDVDSIEKEHWKVADRIRAAGDVMVAVVTGEKYRDDRVVGFFKRAVAEGRVLLPVMNKANPRDDFAVARQQLGEFCKDLGYHGPIFALPFDYALADSFGSTTAPEIVRLDTQGTLLDYLLEMDVTSLKRQVYGRTVASFVGSVSSFLDTAAVAGKALQSAIKGFNDQCDAAVKSYDPMPDGAIGGLFHEFVQSHRGPVRRAIGSFSKAVTDRMGAFRHRLLPGFSGGASASPKINATRQHDQQMIEEVAQSLAAAYMEMARELPEPAGPMARQGVSGIDTESAVRMAVEKAMGEGDLSEEFRRHAMATLDVWWQDNRGKRQALEALDTILAVAPAAVAIPIAVYTGPGLPEATLAFGGAFAQQFIARVLEYQFGDAMFDFLSPWREERRATLRSALDEFLLAPTLAPLRALEPAFVGESPVLMRRELARLLELI